MAEQPTLGEITDGLSKAIRDPDVPVQYSPLFMAARRLLNENETERLRVTALLAPRPVRVWLRNNGQESAHYGELVKIEDYNGEPGNG